VTIKRLVCIALVLLLSACVPIGFRSQNLPFNAASGSHP